jgi:hypothetical protein
MSGVPDSTEPSAESSDENRGRAPEDRVFGAADVEDLAVRNYDAEQGYDLDVVVRDPEGPETVLRAAFHLDPGETATTADLPDGTYEVLVEGERGADSAICRVGDGPFESIVVEAGNGVVSASQGF